MKISDLTDIPELNKTHVYVKDKERLLMQINRLIKDGHSKLQIVSDFDHTLTKQKKDGKIVLTSFGMFSECPSIPKSYKDETSKLFATYRPVENNLAMDTNEKIKQIVDWYTAGNNLRIGLKFSYNELMEIAQNMKECFREGVRELIDWSQTHQVPLLVFSAGLGDSVVALLKAANYLTPYVKVISNFLELDDDDRIVGMKGKMIHIFNKNETAIKGTEYYDMVKDRSNVILIGDSLGDAGMAEGMDHCDQVIKVGYLSSDNEGNLQKYLDNFDIVLLNDDTMDVVNAILKLVL